MKKEKELKKVVLEYNDGTKVTLKGKDLSIWIATLESAMVLAHLHNWTNDEYTKLWKRIEAHLKHNKTYP